MHLTAETATQSSVIVNVLSGYFKLIEELKSETELSESDKEDAEERLVNTGNVLNKIIQYKEAYPDENDSFYIKLNQNELVCLLHSIDFYLKIQDVQVTEEERSILNDLHQEGVEFLERFDESKLDESFVRTLFSTYKAELKRYCEASIEQHVDEGNDEVYVFAIYTFPGHHYNLVTMNTVESLHRDSTGDGFEEAASKGFHTELYNPACFDIHCDAFAPDEFENVESDVKELFEMFFELTSEHSDEAYEEDTEEYAKIVALQSLAYELFLQNNIEVLQEVNFEPLNQSHNFCAIVCAYDFSEEEFYGYAKQTIPEEKFPLIFRNAGRVAEDYIDFASASEDEISTYIIEYIKDFYLDTVPTGRYYTEEKVYAYADQLHEIKSGMDDKILTLVERFVAESKPHPANPNQKHYLSIFMPEGRITGHLLGALAESTDFMENTQARVMALLKMVTDGIDLSLPCLTSLPREFANILVKTDPERFPDMEYDLEHMNLTNVSAYLP